MQQLYHETFTRHQSGKCKSRKSQVEPVSRTPKIKPQGQPLIVLIRNTCPRGAHGRFIKCSTVWIDGLLKNTISRNERLRLDWTLAEDKLPNRDDEFEKEPLKTIFGRQ